MPANPALAGQPGTALGGRPGERTAAGRSDNPTEEIRRLLDEIERLRQQTGQISPNPTQQDIDLVQRIQQATLTPALAQISGGFGSRGLTGSSLEAAQRAQMAGQVGIAGAQQLQDLGFRRGEFELTRNQQLFNYLTQAAQTTTQPGAPGTQVKRRGGGFLGALGGILGGVAGSVLGPVGGAIGSRIGNAIFTQNDVYDPYRTTYYGPNSSGPLAGFGGGPGSRPY